MAVPEPTIDFPPLVRSPIPLRIGLAAAALAVGLVSLFAWPTLSVWFLFGVAIQGFAPAYVFAGLRLEAIALRRAREELVASEADPALRKHGSDTWAESAWDLCREERTRRPDAATARVLDWRTRIANRANVYIAGSGLAGLAGLGMLYSFRLSPIPERRELLGDTVPLMVGALSMIICGMFAFRLIRDWDSTFQEWSGRLPSDSPALSPAEAALTIASRDRIAAEHNERDRKLLDRERDLERREGVLREQQTQFDRALRPVAVSTPPTVERILPPDDADHPEFGRTMPSQPVSVPAPVPVSITAPHANGDRAKPQTYSDSVPVAAIDPEG